MCISINSMHSILRTFIIYHLSFIIFHFSFFIKFSALSVLPQDQYLTVVKLSYFLFGIA